MKMYTVMLVNYDISIIAEQKEILTRNGYTVVGETTDVDQIADKLKHLNPDIIILAHHPANFDCIEVIKTIQSICNPIIIISSIYDTATGVVCEAMQLGTKGWVIPFPSQHEIMLLEQVKFALI